jgi:transportin-1
MLINVEIYHDDVFYILQPNMETALKSQ